MMPTQLNMGENKQVPRVAQDVAIPSRAQCREFFEEYHVPHNVRVHCGRVHRVAVVIATLLVAKGVELNVEFVERLAVLHDLFKMIGIKEFGSGAHKGETLSARQIDFWTEMKKKFPVHNETEVAHEIFKDDFPELAVALKNLGASTVADSWEQMIVHYSDFRVFKNNVVSIEERLLYLQNQYSHPPSWWAAYATHVVAIEKKIFEILDFSADELARVVESGEIEHVQVVP